MNAPVANHAAAARSPASASAAVPQRVGSHLRFAGLLPLLGVLFPACSSEGASYLLFVNSMCAWLPAYPWAAGPAAAAAFRLLPPNLLSRRLSDIAALCHSARRVPRC